MWPREVIFDGTAGDGKKMMARSLDILKKSGVYVLYRDDIPYYIGQAKRLQARLWQHAWNPNSRHYNFWNFFSVFVINESKHMNEVEAILIAAMPTANSARPRMEREKIPKEVVSRMREIRRSRVSAEPM
jgi:predicted GIY-YIG superfamily endonuclease